jgi:hypothetical protein
MHPRPHIVLDSVSHMRRFFGELMPSTSAATPVHPLSAKNALVASLQWIEERF